MKEISKATENRVHTNMKQSIEQLEQSIKEKKEMLNKLNEEINKDIEIKQNLETSLYYLFEEE